MSNETNKKPEIQNPFSPNAAKVVAASALEVKNSDNHNNKIRLV